MSKHAFSSVICRDDTRQVHRPSDRELDVNWKSPVQGESPPVQVKESSLLSILGSMCIFNCLFYMFGNQSSVVLVKIFARKRIKVRVKIFKRKSPSLVQDP